jgi:hypothetical protein
VETLVQDQKMRRLTAVLCRSLFVAGIKQKPGLIQKANRQLPLRIFFDLFQLSKSFN